MKVFVFSVLLWDEIVKRVDITADNLEEAELLCCEQYGDDFELINAYDI